MYQTWQLPAVAYISVNAIILMSYHNTQELANIGVNKKIQVQRGGGSEIHAQLIYVDILWKVIINLMKKGLDRHRLQIRK